MAFINVAALKPGARPPPRPQRSAEEKEYSHPELNKPIIGNNQRTPRVRQNKFLEDATVEELQAQIQLLSGSVEREKARADTAERERRSSNAFLSNRMMSAIVDAEQQNRADAENYEQKIHELEGVIRELQAKVEAGSNDTPEETRSRAMSNYSQKMFKHLLEAEAEQQEDRQKIKVLEEENEMLRNELTQLNSMRGRSFSEYSQRMWRHLLEAEHETAEQQNKWKEKIAELEAQLRAEQRTIQKVEKERRRSVSEVSRKMFRHLLNAEEDARKDRNRDLQEIDELKLDLEEKDKEIESLKRLLAVEQDKSEKVERDRAGSIKYLSNKRMNDLMEAEQQLEELNHWKRRVDLLEAEVRLYQNQIKYQEENGAFLTTPGGPDEYMGNIDDYDGTYDGNTPGGPNMTPGGPNITPGGDEDDDIMRRILELEEEVEYLRASKLLLIQRTSEEIDSLRTSLTTMGKLVTKSRRTKRSSGWLF